MLNELEEFLRRAAQRALEAQQKQLAQQQPPRPPPMPQPQRATAPPPRPVPRLSQQDVVEAELIDQPDRVAQSVQQSMRSSQQVSQHASHLGQRVAQADEAANAHAHQTFDHKLGRLTAGGGSTLPTEAAASTDTYAASTTESMHPIAQLLANPMSIRNAIMLREILDRPADRWAE